MATHIPKPPSLQVLTSPDWQDYELLDSGDGQKLERYGAYILLRPEPEAVWRRSLPEREWSKAHAVFKPAPEENGGHWQPLKKLPERWTMQYKQLRFYVQTTASRHLGVFPEQAAQWDWITQQIESNRRPLRVLNLFGYTGLASLAAAQAGAAVTHLDASRKVVQWANDNLTFSNLGDRGVRWIVDDALKFVQREARRNSTYDGIILDPPKFGRGPKGEVWEFYKLLPTLLDACRQILSQQSVFVALTAYAVKASPLTLYYALQEMLAGKTGTLTAGEIALTEKSAGRLLSTAIFARWTHVE
ncbi:MAG: class I SAM-dependent methyltransferase [Bellilinea sp.]